MNHPITRRQMIVASTLLAIPAFGKKPIAAPYRYVPARWSGPKPILPADRYVPFDWAIGEVLAAGVPATGVPAANDPVQGGGAKLTWKPVDVSSINLATGSSVRLRITSATDVRENCMLSVKTAVSGKVVGSFDIRFAMYLQPFELTIPAAYLQAVLAEGVTLTMEKGSKPFWFFLAEADSPSAPIAYQPHLIVIDNQAAEIQSMSWKARLFSLDSVQSFGWMEGCVMDGLYELSKTSARAKQVLSGHLDLFFGNNSLVYADLNNRKAVGKIHTVESILPFAILAQTNPGHPLLQTAIEFCQAHANSEGVIADGNSTSGSPADRMLKTEECYTVSYPLAVLAKTLKRPDLAQLAIQTALARVRLLTKDKSIYQRGTESGTLFFENWSRGVVWYLLGLVKTLAHLPPTEQTEPLKVALRTAVDHVLSYQQVNGLWYCFMHQPETGLETSGTAGFAAALTYGVQQNLLPKTVMKAVEKAQKGLMLYLTPDGYLTGTAQGNKGGDALQRNGFRVISPYTLGFLAHLNL